MSTAQGYQRFADVEARGSSPTYVELARHVAGAPALLDLLDTLPPGKRQPNLLFGVGRLLDGPVHDPAAFTAWAAARWPEVSAEMLSRGTQTNEAARCATLLPLMAGIPGPLALLEVGASAGLCLYPDRYRYDYDGTIVGGTGAQPTLACSLENDVPLPARLPEVVWRAGLDLNPLDVTTDDDLPALAARAPADATLVVFHSAVLAYADPQQRRRFAEVVSALPGHWLANEAPAVLEGLVGVPAAAAPRPDSFLLALDGVPKAWTGPHGQSLFWLD
jgi:hypothetical protein